MCLLKELLNDDPSSPRLTVYGSDGSRMEFSGQTLNNWVSKISNLLIQELGVNPGEKIIVDLPLSWHQAMLLTAAYTSGITVVTGEAADSSRKGVENIFTSLDKAPQYSEGEVFIVSTDPFGRGIEESGSELEFGTLDYAPLVRVQPDSRMSPELSPEPILVDRLGELETSEVFTGLPEHSRMLVSPKNPRDLMNSALEVWSAQGSLVLVCDSRSTDELEALAETEKATLA